jgi:hypothetical protein
MKWSRRGHGQAVVGVGVEGGEGGGIREHLFFGGLVEPLGPVEAEIRGAPVHAPQVVHHVAAGHDEHATLAQRRQLGAQFEVEVQGLVGVDGKLHHRDRCVRERVHEDGPGAVVDAPAVDVRADPGRTTTSEISSASSGSPVRGYCTANNSRGKP